MLIRSLTRSPQSQWQSLARNRLQVALVARIRLALRCRRRRRCRRRGDYLSVCWLADWLAYVVVRMCVCVCVRQ